jgi:hypothetical protein
MHWARLWRFSIFRHFASALESGETLFAGRLAFVPSTPWDDVEISDVVAPPPLGSATAGAFVTLHAYVAGADLWPTIF